MDECWRSLRWCGGSTADRSRRILVDRKYALRAGGAAPAATGRAVVAAGPASVRKRLERRMADRRRGVSSIAQRLAGAAGGSAASRTAQIPGQMIRPQ